MQRITPFLWFDDKAEEAAVFYTSIFKNSKIGTLLVMEIQVPRSAEDPRGRS